MIGERLAIVEDVPGTTRDRLYGEYEWNGRAVALADTGGLTSRPIEDLGRSVMAQAEVAIEEADLIVLVVDVRSGVTPVDEEIARRLRQVDTPVLVAANKADNREQMDLAIEFHALGLGTPEPVSAERGLGTGDLLDRMDAMLPPPQEEPENADTVRLAIVGRPNVGKSSIVNALVGEERMVVASEPGTTRDAVDTEIRYHGRRIVLVDTAGIRRRGRIVPGIERYSVLRAHRAIDRSDVAALIVDATEPEAAQDAHIAGFVEEEAKGLVIGVNKWDLVVKHGTTINEYERALREHLKFVDYAPITFISALTKQRIDQLLQLALSVADERRRRIPTAQLNEVLRKAVADYQPPARHGKQVRLLYVTQVAVDPPRFLFFVNDPELIHFSYRRFLENRLRERFGFMGTPIRLSFRQRSEAGTSNRGQ